MRWTKSPKWIVTRLNAKQVVRATTRCVVDDWLGTGADAEGGKKGPRKLGAGHRSSIQTSARISYEVLYSAICNTARVRTLLGCLSSSKIVK